MEIIILQKTQIDIIIIKKIIESINCNYPVVGFTDEEEAIKYIKRNKIDMLVFDVDYKKIVKEVHKLNIPIYLIQISYNSNDAFIAFQNDIQSFITRPILFDKFKRCFDNAHIRY